MIIMLSLDPDQFTLMRPLPWSEVWEIWRTNEANRAAWTQHFTSRGFKSWEEWRQNYINDFHCAERQWQLYRIVNPLQSIPNFHGGPFRTWIERYYDGQPQPT